MKTSAKWLVLLVLCGGTAFSRGNANAASPQWKIDLTDKFKFQAFDRPVSFRWTLNQDVLFLSPDKLLVYQVNRANTLARLSPRDASGGGGNFVLDVRILSTLDGHEIKSLHFITNADATEVLATREGRFLVRTGEILYLYSAGFERMASKPLPRNKRVREEAWQIGVSPTGAEVVVVHNQILKRDPKSPTSDVMNAIADIEILNEETLQVTKNFTLPWFIGSWSAGEHVLVTSKPSPVADASTYGLLDFNGNWSPLLFAWYSPMQPCAYQARAVDARLFVTYGCGTLSVFPQNGQTVFTLRSSGREAVGKVKGSEGKLAVLVDRDSTRMDNAANIPIAVSKPLRIDVYDLKTRKGILSAAVQRGRIYYAVAPQSTLAVVDGTTLALYRTGP